MSKGADVDERRAARARQPRATTPVSGSRSPAPRSTRASPPKIASGQALHRAIARTEADRIAAAIGLHPRDAFTPRQFRRCITGRGVGARKDAARMLDRSVRIFTNAAGHGLASQSIPGTAQLVKNTLDGETREVGMSMVPSIWIDFALVYVLEPSLTAQMPAQWAPIPRAVVRAIKASRTGQVS